MDVNRIQRALLWLKEYNKLYKDVHIPDNADDLLPPEADTIPDNIQQPDMILEFSSGEGSPFSGFEEDEYINVVDYSRHENESDNCRGNVTKSRTSNRVTSELSSDVD